MKLQDLLEELKPSQYRQYVKGWDKSRYKEIFQKYTSDPKAYRIYLPIKGKIDNTTLRVPKTVIGILDAMGYVPTPDSYRAGLCHPRKSDSPDIIDASMEGIDDQKTYRIGRLIQDIIDRGANKKNTQHLEDMQLEADEHADGNIKKFAEMALKDFNSDPQRQAFKEQNFYIVISRHPYDIAGMSTNRGWKSCMNLQTGLYKDFIEMDVKHGTLVAYLVKPSDKNVNHPVGRVLIKPFVSMDDPDQVAFGVENQVYGTDVKGFREQVCKWADEVNASKQLDGIFVFNDKLYADGIPAYKNFMKDPVKNGDKIVIEIDDVDHWKDRGAKIVKVGAKRGVVANVSGIVNQGGNHPTDGKYVTLSIPVDLGGQKDSVKLRFTYPTMYQAFLKKL